MSADQSGKRIELARRRRRAKNSILRSPVAREQEEVLAETHIPASSKRLRARVVMWTLAGDAITRQNRRKISRALEAMVIRLAASSTYPIPITHARNYVIFL